MVLSEGCEGSPVPGLSPWHIGGSLYHLSSVHISVSKFSLFIMIPVTLDWGSPNDLLLFL